MEDRNTPRDPDRSELEAKVLVWQELKLEMQKLHAQVEYMRLMLRLGVGQR